MSTLLSRLKRTSISRPAAGWPNTWDTRAFHLQLEPLARGVHLPTRRARKAMHLAGEVSQAEPGQAHVPRRDRGLGHHHPSPEVRGGSDPADRAALPVPIGRDPRRDGAQPLERLRQQLRRLGVPVAKASGEAGPSHVRLDPPGAHSGDVGLAAYPCRSRALRLRPRPRSRRQLVAVDDAPVRPPSTLLTGSSRLDRSEPQRLSRAIGGQLRRACLAKPTLIPLSGHSRAEMRALRAGAETLPSDAHDMEHQHLVEPAPPDVPGIAASMRNERLRRP